MAYANFVKRVQQIAPNFDINNVQEVMTALGNYNNASDQQVLQACNNITTQKEEEVKAKNLETHKLTPYESKAASKIKTALISMLGWTDFQADGLLSMIRGEAHFNPTLVNKWEKTGSLKGGSVSYDVDNTGKSKEPYRGAYSYGAGIIQWSGWNRKLKALRSIGKDEKWLTNVTVGTENGGPGGIEGCSLDEQIKMLIYELKSMAGLNSAIMNSKSSKEAFFLTYNNLVAGYNSNPTLNAQQSEQQALVTAEKYRKINKKKVSSIGERLPNLDVLAQVPVMQQDKTKVTGRQYVQNQQVNTQNSASNTQLTQGANKNA